MDVLRSVGRCPTQVPMSPSSRADARVASSGTAPDGGTSTGAREPAVDLNDPSLYLNRDLSWLKFNARVLMQARDAAHPLLERVKFLSIAASNLDEFYNVRVAALRRLHTAGRGGVSADGLDVLQQLRSVRHAADAMLHDVGREWTDDLRPALEVEGIHFLEPGDYTSEIQAYLSERFNTALCPVLTPLAVDPAHP